MVFAQLLQEPIVLPKHVTVLLSRIQQMMSVTLM